MGGHRELAGRVVVGHVANRGPEPDLVADILETRSRSVLLPRLRMRGTMIIQGLLAIQVGDKGYIVRHKLGAIYQSETSALEDASGQVSVEDLVARLQETPLARMAFAQITVFFSDMSGLRRREGLASLRPLIEVAGHPLLRRGLAMICDQVDSAETRAVLEELQKEELGQIEARHRIVITGIPGMQRGGQPRCP